MMNDKPRKSIKSRENAKGRNNGGRDGCIDKGKHRVRLGDVGSSGERQCGGTTKVWLACEAIDGQPRQPYGNEDEEKGERLKMWESTEVEKARGQEAASEDGGKERESGRSGGGMAGLTMDGGGAA